MAAPPANAPGPAVSGMITMRIDPSLAGKDGVLYSPMTHIFGLPWRLVAIPVPSARVVLHLPPFPGHEYDVRPPVYHSVQLHCAADAEFELWRARVRFVMQSLRYSPRALRMHKEVHHTFTSWRQQPYLLLTLHSEWVGPHVDAVRVTMWMEADGARLGSPRQPQIDSLRAYRSDVALVAIGPRPAAKEQRFVANKQVLCNASLAFHHIFIQRCGVEREEKEKDEKENREKKDENGLEEVEIDLQGRDPADFQQVLRMIYGMPTEPITEKSVWRLLSIVDMFDIKFLRDRLENFLLSSKEVSLNTKRTLAWMYDLQMLKDEVVPSGDLPSNPGK